MIALVTGGTGTLGKALIPLLLKSGVERVRVLSRDEHKQIKLHNEWNDDRIDWLLGDVTDAERVWYASRGVGHVYHLAATKSVDWIEYNPNQAIATNIIGTQNVVKACVDNGVQKAIFTSTDKACDPVNTYGASKQVAEKLFIQSNCYGGGKTHFMCVRYGNVMASNGSVIEKWKRSLETGARPMLTDGHMTRFFISPDMAARFVHSAMESGEGGEVFIPKMKSTTVEDLYRAFCHVYEVDVEPRIIGVRPGEKMHESLVSPHEVQYVTDVGFSFVRWPSHDVFHVKRNGDPVNEVPTSFEAERLSIGELSELIGDVL